MAADGERSPLLSEAGDGGAGGNGLAGPGGSATGPGGGLTPSAPPYGAGKHAPPQGKPAVGGCTGAQGRIGAEGGGACSGARCGSMAPVTGRGILPPRQSLPPEPGAEGGPRKTLRPTAVRQKHVELCQQGSPPPEEAPVASARMMMCVYLLPLQHFPRSPRGTQPCCLERTHPPTHP